MFGLNSKAIIDTRAKKREREMNRWKLSGKISGVIALSVLLASCSGAPKLPTLKNLNPFKEEEKRLQGERKAIMSSKEALQIDADAVKTPVKIPEQTLNVAWSQPGGSANNSPGHLALGKDLRRAWNLDTGKGSSKKGQLTASPVIYNGRVFTLDSHGQVRAFTIPGGTRSWQVSMTPKNEKAHEGFGGGLAVSDGILFVATGYGWVTALNPGTGAKLWEKNLGVPVRTSPTASGGKVYITTTEGRTYALGAGDGAELWTARGISESASLLSNVSPAVAGDKVVVPYAVGEVVAFDAKSGQPVWSESLVRSRGGSALSGLNSPARPVIDRGIVYAVSQSGRMLATKRDSGERVWTQNIRSNQTPAVAGNSVFVVESSGNMIALNRSDGKIRWVTNLPKARNWYGPVLAGDRLWAVASSGELVGIAAADGRVATTKKLDTSVHIAPIVASGRMYIYTDKAKLISLN